MKLDHKNPRDLLELGHRPGHLIWRAQQRAWRVFREAAGASDITPVQASVLLVIADRPGIDQRRLADTISLDKATTGNVVARLLKRGLIMRMTPPSDRRVRALYVTPSGKRLNVKLGIVTRRARACLVECLTADAVRELVRLLRKVSGLSDDNSV